MNTINLWNQLESILKKYKYLETILDKKGFSKKIAFECLECLISLDELEDYYIELKDINLSFEEKFNDKEVNGLIVKVRNLLTECILDRTVFTPEYLIHDFKIIEFEKKNFVFIENPFSKKILRLKTHLYITALNYFPVKKIAFEIKIFRDKCINNNYFLKKELDLLLDKYSYYTSLIRMIMFNQLKIENWCMYLEVYNISYFNIPYADMDLIDIENYYSYKDRIKNMRVLYKLSNDITLNLLREIDIYPDAKTLDNLKNNIFIKLYCLSTEFYNFLLSYNFNYIHYLKSSVLSHETKYWRDIEDKPKIIFLEGEVDFKTLSRETYNPVTYYNFFPKIFEDVKNSGEKGN